MTTYILNEKQSCPLTESICLRDGYGRLFFWCLLDKEGIEDIRKEKVSE